MPEGGQTRLRVVDSAADWERVLEAAASLQHIVPEAVLVGGSAAAIHAAHRFSRDDDHVVRGLRERFDGVLADLEAVAGWKTARVQRPVQILGSLNGVDTGVRNLRRVAPLETESYETTFGPIRLPTLREMLRIKGWLVVVRNATRDYVDVAALADALNQRQPNADEAALLALDDVYPQENTTSVALQLAKQLAEPRPYDLEADGNLRIYRMLDDRWSDWTKVAAHNRQLGARLLRGHALRGRL